jgi:hypothetical protein
MLRVEMRRAIATALEQRVNEVMLVLRVSLEVVEPHLDLCAERGPAFGPRLIRASQSLCEVKQMKSLRLWIAV